MAHNLMSRRDGGAAMFYRKLAPWHGLGKMLPYLVTAEEAIVAAGLDWNVELQPLFAHVPDFSLADGSHYFPVAGRKAVMRDAHVLGVVSDRFTPVQNNEAFAFMDSVVGRAGAHYETAGALGNGETVWMLIKFPDDIKVGKQDIVQEYLLLTNGHDGTQTLSVRFTPIRVVCQNTLSYAMREQTATFRAIHKASIKDKVRDAQETLGIIVKEFEILSETYNKLLHATCNVEIQADYISQLWPVPPEPKQATSAHWDAHDDATEKIYASRREVAEIIETGSGSDIPDVKGTLWNAYNGVVEYVDHFQRTIKGERRMTNLVFGLGADFKRNALDVAISLAHV